MQASHIDPDSGPSRDEELAQHHIFSGFTRLHRQTAATYLNLKLMHEQGRCKRQDAPPDDHCSNKADSVSYM